MFFIGWIISFIFGGIYTKKVFVECMDIDASEFEDMSLLVFLGIVFLITCPYLNTLWAGSLFLIKSMHSVAMIIIYYRIKFTKDSKFGFVIYKGEDSFYYNF